jgi:hypothetical protein
MTDESVVMRRKAVRVGMLALVVVGMVVAGATRAEAATAKIRYGPYTIPAEGMVHNDITLNVAKPCGNCWITGMTPDLEYADGSNANVDTGVMLHHFVLTNQDRTDATCGGTPLGQLGERFFASGNERTPMKLPSGYGYYVASSDRFNFLADLMNMDVEAKTVYIDVTYSYSTRSKSSARPVWLDIDECGDSEYSIPAGFSDTHWDWRVNVPGDVLAIAGHVHTDGHGVRIAATVVGTKQRICNSVATYGGPTEYYDMDGMPYISNMSSCLATPVITLSQGQTVRLHSIYNSPEARNDVMGIMIAYIHPN